MENLVELRENWWWPKKDHGCWKYLRKRQDVPSAISQFVKTKNTVVQAGGNAGMYVKFYQDIFQTVYTFEPDPINFYCLVKNTGLNVIKSQACLGDENKLVSISHDLISDSMTNAGGYYVTGSGHYPVIKIDDLNLNSCDLIHLDIEGYEGQALTGGLETIKNFKPVIALELVNHGEKFGWPDQRIRDFLFDLGYKELDTSAGREDRIFI